MQDLQNKESRLEGYKSQTEWINRNKVYLIIVWVVLIVGLVFAVWFQDYLKSFSRSQQQARLPFTKVEPVESWVIVKK